MFVFSDEVHWSTWLRVTAVNHKVIRDTMDMALATAPSQGCACPCTPRLPWCPEQRRTVAFDLGRARKQEEESRGKRKKKLKGGRG